MVYGILAVLTSMGWTYVMLILSHCVLLYSISLVKLRWLCFTTGLVTLATFKMEPFVSWQVEITNMYFCEMMFMIFQLSIRFLMFHTEAHEM